METLTVRITRAAHAVLKELSEEVEEPMTEVLSKAIEAYRRHCFLTALNADFAALRADPGAWAEEDQERAAWDATLGDGLD